MTRAERRRQERVKNKAKMATYNLTYDQLEMAVRSRIKDELAQVREQATSDGVNAAMCLLFVLPMEVLMDYYWPKSYAKRIPEFTAHLFDYYERWQNGELDMDKMKEDLWKYGGVRFEEKP